MNQNLSDVRPVTCDDTEIKAGLAVSTGKKFEIAIEVPKGHLACFLLDEDMIDVLPHYAYEIHGRNGKILEGETDEYGYFRHDDLPADHYTLKANDVDFEIPTLQEDDEPYQIRVLGQQQPEMDEELRIIDITEEEE